MPPIDGLDEAAPVDQPRGDDGEARSRRAWSCSAAAWSASSWRRRGRRSGPGSRWSRAPSGCSPREEPFAGEQVADGAARGTASTCAPASQAPIASRERRRASWLRARRRRRRSRRAELLVAVGRTAAHRRSIGLETVGVEPGKGGYLEVDDADAGRRARLALRDRRRQRPRAAHPHGQVPGAGRRRERTRAPGRGHSRRARLTPRHLHRSPGRRSRTDARARRGDAGITARAVDVPTDGTRRRQLPRQGNRQAPPGSSSTSRARS